MSYNEIGSNFNKRWNTSPASPGRYLQSRKKVEKEELRGKELPVNNALASSNLMLLLIIVDRECNSVAYSSKRSFNGVRRRREERDPHVVPLVPAQPRDGPEVQDGLRRRHILRGGRSRSYCFIPFERQRLLHQSGRWPQVDRWRRSKRRPAGLLDSRRRATATLLWFTAPGPALI